MNQEISEDKAILWDEWRENLYWENFVNYIEEGLKTIPDINDRGLEILNRIMRRLVGFATCPTNKELHLMFNTIEGDWYRYEIKEGRGDIYLARCSNFTFPGGCMVKIGFTTNIINRQKELKGVGPLRFEILYSWPSDYAKTAEREILEVMRGTLKVYKKEYFIIDIDALVGMILAFYGVPEPSDYQKPQDEDEEIDLLATFIGEIIRQNEKDNNDKDEDG